jgi:phage gpG-like protein
MIYYKGVVKMKVEFNNNSEQVLSAMGKAIERGLEAIGLTAEGYAKENTPVDTGRLRNSISHAVEDDAVYIGSNVEYAPFV